MQPVVRVVPRCLSCALTLATTALSGACDGDDPVDPIVEVEPREVLLKFYDALGGSGWHRSDNWGTDASLDTWHGVSTDGEGNVIALRLRQNQLVGAIPPEIGMLGSLKSLDLCCGNSLSRLPSEIGKLQNLIHLGLSDTDLSGSLPPEIGSLRNLQGLDLSWNRMTGPIPPELGQLGNLVILNLWENDLTGSIPPELGDLQNTIAIYLQKNDLTGPIPPELGSLRSLGIIELHSNRLTGPIPPEFGNLDIFALTVSENQLSGRLPRELMNVSLRRFLWHDTDLCAPADDAFQEWLRSIGLHEGGANCPSGN